MLRKIGYICVLSMEKKRKKGEKRRKRRNEDGEWE
jgi:hypothetical protein